MSNDNNTKTIDALKTEIKSLQRSCAYTYHVIDNAPPMFSADNLPNEEEQVDTYVRGLDAAVNQSVIPISTDSNLLIPQFLNEINQKIAGIDELTAYTTGAICDSDAEIGRLKNLITTTQEAQSKPVIGRNEVQPEHINKAKERFRMMKMEVHGLLESLFPYNHEDVKSVLGDLMAVMLNNSSDEYIPIAPENFNVVEILKDMNIVTFNPYNQFEVKFNY